MKKLFVAAALLFCVFHLTPAQACDICAIYSAAETKENKPGFNIGMLQQYTHFATLSDGGHEIPDPAGQFLNSSITQLIIGYQMSERFGVQLNLPWIHRDFKRAEGFTIDRGTVDGLGDISLIGTVRLYETAGMGRIFTWNAFGGVKFPSGSSLRISEELAEEEPLPGEPVSGIHGHDLTLGSGSYDGLIGSSVAYYFGRIFATAGAQYAIRSRGAFGYKFANDLSWSFKPGYFLIAADTVTLGAQFSVAGEAKGKDDLNGVSAVDTGVTSVFLGPELSFTLGQTLSADFELGIPVMYHNTNVQEIPDYRLRAAVVFRL